MDYSCEKEASLLWTGEGLEEVDGSSKSQCIQGSKALALPASSTATVLLDMTLQECQWFGRANASVVTILRNVIVGGGAAFHVEHCLL